MRIPRTRPPGWWRAAAYMAVALPFLFLLASLVAGPRLDGENSPDWRAAFTQAETARERGDPYQARHLYSKTGRLASWREDWIGLLAAACGMKKLDRGVDANFITHSILVRAMMAAETRQSRAGISAVAGAFTAIGEHRAASMALSRIRTGWHEDQEQVGGSNLADCWRSESVDDRRASDAGR